MYIATSVHRFHMHCTYNTLYIPTTSISRYYNSMCVPTNLLTFSTQTQHKSQAIYIIDIRIPIFPSFYPAVFLSVHLSICSYLTAAPVAFLWQVWPSPYRFMRVERPSVAKRFLFAHLFIVALEVQQFVEAYSGFHRGFVHVGIA